MTALVTAEAVRLEARLKPTSLEVEAGELIAVIGPNGGGKTSLLRILASIEGKADVLTIGGEAVAQAPPARRSYLLSFLPATREVTWPISVRDTISLGLPAPDPGRTDELLQALELEPLADRPLTALSTGERLRALLARACAARPKLLLLDEPLSNLDPYWALTVLELLRQQVTEGAAALVSLHDLHQLRSFDRVLLLDGGQVILDASPASVLESLAFRESFRVNPDSDGWVLRRPADPQSSP